jgi:hypothetical protein
MGYIIKNTSGLVNTRLTDTGRLKLSQGNFNISYFQIGDSEVSYNTLPSTYNQFETMVLEPSFNAQNSSGIPQSNKENVKYPYYVDGFTGNTYGIPFMDSIVSPVYNRAVMRGFFTGNTTDEPINWSALTNNLYAVNSNYVIKMNLLTGSNKVDLIYNQCNSQSLREPSVGDIITIYYDGNGLKNCNCSNQPIPSPTPTPTPSQTPPKVCLNSTFTILGKCLSYPLTYKTCNGTLVETDVPLSGLSACIDLSFEPIFDPVCISLTLEDSCESPTPTPTPEVSSNPCSSPTPTPTPSATFCPTPTPSRACPPPPPPNCVVDMSSCYPILTYRIVDVCFNTITLDRPTPNFSYLSTNCYARTIIYPPSMVPFYDSHTPRPHWNDNVINFESVCYTDEFDVKIWNMNIPWSESPAGINSAVDKDYTQFGSIQYLGTKEYLGYASSSGQTDTDSVYYFNSFGDKIIVTPEEQKAIAILHYTNQTVDFFYGEKFALEPFENVDDTTGQARNFRVHLPWLMWHKNPDCCHGQTFWVDPPGFEELDLFKVHYIESKKNVDMNSPGIRYYHLWDTNPNINGYPNRVGKVFPDAKIIIIDDEELIASMSYKSNRNWTLPAPRLSLITPNTCGTDNNSTVGILTGESETLYVTYRLTNTDLFTNSLHNNYYSVIQGPNLCLPFSSQNVGIRFGGEFYCLNQPFTPITTTTTTFNPITTTTTTTVSPCWLTGFTFSSNSLLGGITNLDFYPSSLYFNGYPLFYNSVTNSNIYFDGINWVFNNLDNYPTEAQMFTGITPLNNYDFSYGGSNLVGTTSCKKMTNICSKYQDGMFAINTEFYTFELGGLTYYYSILPSTYQISYSGGVWKFTDSSTVLATLSGVSSSEVPIGTWDMIVGDSLQTDLGFCLYDCNCISFTGDSDFNKFNFVTCNGQNVSQSLDSGSSGNLCIYDNRVVITTGFTGATYSGVCETPCSPITLSNNLFNSYTTTTTTICPPYCDITSGFYSNKFEVIVQKVTTGERPNPSEWKIIDFTDQLIGTMINGYITQEGLTGNTFVITQENYDTSPYYNLDDYIDLTSAGFSGTQLNFGDEYYFYGNLETDIQSTIYEMRYKINLGQAEFLSSSNPSWTNGNKSYVTEIGLYDNEKNLMIISKMQSPVLRQGIQQFLIKFDI